MGLNHDRQVEKEIVSNRPVSRAKRIQRAVYVRYGNRQFRLTASDLQLISDALDVLSPDSDASSDRAHDLCSMFSALSEYAETVK